MKGDPSTRNQDLFCTYHKQNGHRTESCMAFKAHLESLVKAGHLKEYIDDGKSSGKKDKGKAKADPSSDQPEGVINVIHTVMDLDRANNMRAEVQKASHIKQVMITELAPTTKKAKKENEGAKIWFSD